MVVNEAQYILAVFAPFGPTAALGSREGFRLRGAADLDQAVARLAGTFRVPAPESLCPERGLDVPVADLAGFKPVNVARNCSWIARVISALDFLDQAVRAGTPPADVARKLREDLPGLPLDLALPEGQAVQSAPASGSATVDAILDMVSGSQEQAPVRTAAGTAAWRAELAGLAASLLAAVYADPVFRAAEAAWRGVKLILQNGGPDSPLALDLIPADGDTLPDALADYAAQAGKNPPGLILADVSLDAAPARMAAWTALAEAADGLLAPVATALSPDFFHLEGWEKLSRIGYPGRALDDAAYAKFRKLAGTSGGGWLSAMFPRAALRAPYGSDNPARVADLRETAPLWGSPVWILGAAVASSLSRSGWPHLFEVGRNVSVGDLAVTVRGSRAMAVEELLSGDQFSDWAAAGFTAIGGKAGGDMAFVPKAVTLDGSALSGLLFLNRILGFFFACRQDEDLAGVLTGSGPDGLAGELARRFALFFERTGVRAPADLEIVPADKDGAVGLDIRFTPPSGLGMGRDRLQFGFTW